MESYERMYSILGGLLFDIDLLNIFASREDYPEDILSDNEAIINICKIIKEVHLKDHITLTWNRYKDVISKTLNIPFNLLDDTASAEIYYTIYEKAEVAYLAEHQDKEYIYKWKAELKSQVESYIRSKTMALSKDKYFMLKQRCFGSVCEKPCELIKHCKKCIKYKTKALDYVMDWHDSEEEKLKSLRMTSSTAMAVSYDSNVDDRIKRYDEEFTHKEKGRKLLGMSTGLDTIDEITGGFVKGHVWAILGRTGKGKSSLALQMSIDSWVEEQVNVLYINLEIPNWDIQKRLDASLTRTAYNKVRNSLWEDKQELTNFKEKLKKLNNDKTNKFKLQDAYELNISSMDQLIRSYYNRWGEGFIVVLDNLNRMTFPSGMKKHEGGNAISVKFHKLIKEFGACGVLVAQLNRSAEGITRQGMLNASHVRDSDQLLDSVSTAFAIVDHMGKDKKRIILMKSRDFDDDRDILLKNNLWRMRMEEVDKKDVELVSDSFMLDDEEGMEF